MEVELPDPKPIVKIPTENLDEDRVRVRRKSLQTVLEQCQRALELLNSTSGGGDGDDEESCEGEATVAGEERRVEGSSSMRADREAEELCDLLKSRVECPAFLEKLECAQASVSQNAAEDGNSWDVICDNDLWESENIDSDQEDYVLVRQEDIVEGIACFMAAYLLSLKQTKDLTPNQLQEALSKTFSTKRRRESFKRHGMGAKLFTMLHHGELLLLGYIKTLLF